VVLWWVPAGHRPSVAEADERLAALRADGPTPRAFTFRESFAPPVDSGDGTADGDAPVRSTDTRPLCPAG
jgi:Domain of unknown function (DUF3291)